MIAGMQPEDAPAPPVSAAAAEHLAREHYALDARASALPGEYDHNFRLDTTGGRRFILKVMHPAREAALIDVQCAALRHAAERAPALPLPRVVPMTDGSSFARVDVDGAGPLVWLLTWLDGTPLAGARPRGDDLLFGLGDLLGRLDAALLDFEHPAARRELKWDLARAGWIAPHVARIADPPRRALVERWLARFEAEVVPALPRLRRGVIHGDANDHNVLAGDARLDPRPITGLFDFGDLHHGLLVAEPAVAAAYATFGQPDVVQAAARVVAGYHAALPLTEDEVALLPALIAMRLAVSVVNAMLRAAERPDDPYVTVSQAPAWGALERWSAPSEALVRARLRDACGLPPVPHAPRVAAFLRDHGRDAAPVLDADLRSTPCLVFDLGVGSLLLGADPRASATPALTETLWAEMAEAGVSTGVGRYGEARAFYAGDLFGQGRPIDERRTIHLGLDLFVDPGHGVHAPFDGSVHLLADNAAPGDYGPLVVLRHVTSDGAEFFTLYGHLAPDALTALRVGQRVARGETFARVGAPPGNGDWPPHLHLQVIADLLDLGADFPGVAYASQRGLWQALSPDPNALVGIPASRFPEAEPDAAASRAARREAIGPSVRLSYRRPLKIVRGFGAYLFDDTGRAYLDAYNNVPLVGHGHPRVVRAAQRQLALLNTNTRYLHDNALRYAGRLTALLPEPLRVCYFLNSGSEANELALRLARAHVGRDDVIVLAHGYHGHTTTLIDVSPYKFDGPGGRGRKGWVHVVPLPDDYRGPHRRGDPRAGEKYAHDVARVLDALRAAGGGPATFLAESLPSVAGQIIFPAGYLDAVYRQVRAAGGCCIADEVQTGFFRLGDRAWGFELQGVVPDIVVLGKPIGNAFPLAAVVTTPEIARAFDNGMEFFSTFGGNPVACAAGLAVLDVLRDEGLAENARVVGAHLIGGLRALQSRHALVGDVRGRGLFLGVELVRDRATLEPAPAEARAVVERLREIGVLAGTDGIHDNVIKLRPPLCFTRADADLLLEALDQALGEDAARA
jgi:4-aminobutyrate aminotransferase-like enzyme/Ser/Thr protein kinase RdoA (MazF antagonist)